MKENKPDAAVPLYQLDQVQCNTSQPQLSSETMNDLFINEVYDRILVDCTCMEKASQ